MILTLQNIPLEVEAALRRKAEEQHRPVDQVAVEAIQAGLGLGNGNINLTASIRARFAPLVGIELAEPIRGPMPEPLDFG